MLKIHEAMAPMANQIETRFIVAISTKIKKIKMISQVRVRFINSLPT